ncbi:alanine--tRNA ligase [Effusibacillus pohliae]|uniref:DHHA1 domain-containing protein n=1 Tax=Effusibacillus pohliae TaxID=232270 RepID=UPI000374E5D5|nr:DHHA1 domain-containing protein [Effusibacillus pohliae]
MGKEVVTVDIARHPLLPEEVAAVEKLVNRVIFENRPITAAFVEPEEAKRLPLRKPPSVTENIRIVTVADFDHSPCGGTHPARTGEIGFVKVLAWEKYKAGTRIEFVCGGRAVAAMDRKQQILRELGRLLGTGESELYASAAKLMNDRKELERSLQETKQTLLQHEAEQLRNQAQLVGSLLVSAAVYENRPMQELQRLAGFVTAAANRVALLASAGDKTNLVFAKANDVNLSMVSLLRAVLPLVNGKGGGNDSIAQGGGAGTGNPQTVLEQALHLLTEQTENRSYS